MALDTPEHRDRADSNLDVFEADLNRLADGVLEELFSADAQYSTVT